MTDAWASGRCVLLALVIGGMCPIAFAAGGDAGVAAMQSGQTAVVEPQVPAERPCPGLFQWCEAPSDTGWSLDYRARWLFDSQTRYEFGMPPEEPQVYTPLSRLDWSLNSVWHGFQIGRRGRHWAVQFEWLAPMQSSVDGNLYDYDWLTPESPDRLDSLSSSALRWNEGQSLDLGGEFRLGSWEILGAPVEIWPTAGFRFQRFAMTAHDGIQLIGDDISVPPPGTPLDGDLITFNQQYYVGYFGGQARWASRVGNLPPITWTFQGDYGAAFGYNIDHHLFYEGYGVHRYTMENTHGGALHLSLAAEMAIRRWLSVGLQLDHTAIRTSGSHRWLTYDDSGHRTDETWDNGVKVGSDQNSLTAFVRARF